MHAKYVDDLTIAEAFNLKQAIIPNPGRELPDAFHDRLGQQLDSEKSKVYEEILQIEEYAAEHEMRLNVAKSKFMFFNPTENFDFTPKFEIDGNEIETMEEMKLLGLARVDHLR